MGTFVLEKTSDGLFHFKLLAANGEPLLSSERYAAKRSALRGIRSVQTNSADETRYERRKARNGKTYFVLAATNGETIGTSQVYSTRWARERGIAACRANGPSSPVRDEAA